jgi:hypothetical protein
MRTIYDDPMEYLDDRENAYDAWMQLMEGYCDYCEEEGHTFRTCPRRDDA